MIISPLSLLSSFHRSEKNKFKSVFKQNFGFSPGDYNLYKQAFSHRSISSNLDSNNERLEFLGDSVLSLIISDMFYDYYPEGNEGFLSKMRSKIANREFLNRIAVNIGIDKFVKFDNNIKMDDRPLTDIYGNAFEAFIGAIYLDKGYMFTRKFIIERIISKYVDIRKIRELEKNYKGKLNELAQKENLEIKFLVDESKANHDIIYNAKVMIDKEILGKGSGHKKKQAEQIAAEEAYKTLISSKKISSKK